MAPFATTLIILCVVYPFVVSSAIMVTYPFAFAVMVPLALTVAMSSFELLKVTFPGTTFLFSRLSPL